MKISYQWLREHLKTKSSPSPQAIAKQLTFKTVEVENITALGEQLEQVVIGKIASIKNHPNADKLKICVVQCAERSDVAVGVRTKTSD